MRIKAFLTGLVALILAGGSAGALVELTGAADITAGGRHTCVLTDSGGVKCWGGNHSGELGDGSTRDRGYAAYVTGMTNGIAAVSAGGVDYNTAHTCALTVAGGVKCWGANDSGQLGDGTTNPSSLPVDVLGLATGVAAISAGGHHTCAVTTGGAVKCWGSNGSGELGDGTNTPRLSPVDVTGLSSGVATVAATELHTCALTTGGGMLCWGANDFGQLGDGTTTASPVPVGVSSLSSGVAEISTGRGAGLVVGLTAQSGGNSCAVTAAGAAKCWGSNTSSQIGDGTTTQRLTPFEVTGLGSGTASISVGSFVICAQGLGGRSSHSHTCAVTTGGAAKCWGGNGRDQVGVPKGSFCERRTTPQDVSTLGSGQLAVATGQAFSCSLGNDTKVRCWGTNEVGEDHPDPRPVMATSSGQVTQSITFGPPPTIPVGGTGTVTATGGGSGNPVIFTSLTPAVCSVSGSTVTGHQNAICTIAANQAGNATFEAAPQATQDILIGNKLNQTITFGPAPVIAVGGTGTVSANASSGLPVTFTSNTPSICSVSGNVVTGNAAGTCTIAASQSGNTMYNAAPQKTQNITVTSSSTNLSVSQTQSVDPAYVAKDIMYTVTVSNSGPSATSSVTLQDVLQSGVAFVWASSACSHAAGTVTCSLGTMESGASVQVKVVVRPSAAGTLTHTVTVSGSIGDSDNSNNTASSTTTVNSNPTATAVVRYRLYSDGTKEHLFTTDQNEYNVLGGSGAWTQEGTAGKVLANPGSFNGVEAMPYYRLYNSSSTWHHWTTDANEYYTLIEFPDWHGEGVDGYILPTMTAGATQLYRLLYPFVPGLHHWTIDANEYATLTDSDHGWIGEGGAGFVIQ